ncbi:MAG: hypothetical protein AAF160_00780 [Pseudomonadota bacterium]
MLNQPDIPFRSDGIRLMRYMAIEISRRAPQHFKQVQSLHRQPVAAAVRTAPYARIEHGHQA